MNRQQRRRLKKQGKEVKKEPVINVKKSDIKRYADQAAEKLKKQATDDAFIITLAVPLYVLRHKYGFGKKRLSEFLDHVLFQYECISSDHVTLTDMQKLILEETGVNVWGVENIERIKDKERAN